MDYKGCPMGSLNIVFRPDYPSLPFVPKGLMDSKGHPVVSLNIAFSPCCLSLPFVPKRQTFVQ